MFRSSFLPAGVYCMKRFRRSGSNVAPYPEQLQQNMILAPNEKLANALLDHFAHLDMNS